MYKKNNNISFLLIQTTQGALPEKWAAYPPPSNHTNMCQVEWSKIFPKIPLLWYKPLKEFSSKMGSMSHSFSQKFVRWSNDIFLQKNGQDCFVLIQATEKFSQKKGSISPFFSRKTVSDGVIEKITKFVDKICPKNTTPQKFLPEKWAALPPSFHRWEWNGQNSPPAKNFSRKTGSISPFSHTKMMDKNERKNGQNIPPPQRIILGADKGG